MWNTPTRRQLARLPKLYETESVALDEKMIYVHFFIGGCDWFIAEYDGDDMFFGFANLNNPDMAEWGYVSFRELKEININGFQVDFDLHWTPKPFKMCNWR